MLLLVTGHTPHLSNAKETVLQSSAQRFLTTNNLFVFTSLQLRHLCKSVEGILIGPSDFLKIFVCSFLDSDWR